MNKIEMALVMVEAMSFPENMSQDEVNKWKSERVLELTRHFSSNELKLMIFKTMKAFKALREKTEEQD